MGGLFLLRLAVGSIFIYHSAPKLKDSQKMASSLGWGSNQVFALGVVEFICALGLIGGIGVRLAALFLSVVMLGAIFYKVKRWHVPFMSTNSTGWEFDMLMLASTVTFYLKY